MGLGKTIQSIAFLTTLYENLHNNPSVAYPTGKKVLILAPLITLENWVNEFRKWHVDGFSSILGQVFNFSGISSEYKYKRIKYLKYWYINGGVMLMNYDQFRHLMLSSSDKEDFYSLLINPGPDVVILDEGHIIRNSSSHISRLVSEFRTRARICLTGYPLQNHLLEYYHMLNFIAPGMLGSQENFKSYFTFYIEKSYADSSSSIKRNALCRFYTLQILTNEVTHRRDSEAFEKDLPPKTEYIVKFKMTDIQRLGYIMTLETIVHQSSLLNNLFVLRTICNHPKIFQKILSARKSKRREKFYIKEANTITDENYMDILCENETASPDNDNTDESINANKNNEATLSENEEAETPDWGDDWDDDAFCWTTDYFKNNEIESWKSSNKISFIVDLAMDCKVIDEKLLIVSHSIACHDYLQHLFSIINIQTSRVDGNTLSNVRQSIINSFNSDKSKHVLLLSAKAAAIGINVTGANRIVLVDQDWNPLYDEQSVGRIYRYGQSKPVTVYRLITASSIEERIFAQSVHKKSISRRLIDNKISSVVSKEELKDYYVMPELDLPQANMDDIRNYIQPDFVTYSALLQNKQYLTEFDIYSIKAVDVYDPTTKLTKEEKEIAAAEALKFLKKWRQKYSDFL
ncbi:unnamed protein product [Rhizopus stolonifer]